jgi:hypothetical protein
VAPGLNFCRLLFGGVHTRPAKISKLASALHSLKQSLRIMLGGNGMSKLDDRTVANMNVVLEDACRRFPNGGDHERRKYIAQKLKLSAQKGNRTLGGLSGVAQSALQELSKQKSA